MGLGQLNPGCNCCDVECPPDTVDVNPFLETFDSQATLDPNWTQTNPGNATIAGTFALTTSGPSPGLATGIYRNLPVLQQQPTVIEFDWYIDLGTITSVNSNFQTIARGLTDINIQRLHTNTGTARYRFFNTSIADLVSVNAQWDHWRIEIEWQPPPATPQPYYRFTLYRNSTLVGSTDGWITTSPPIGLVCDQQADLSCGSAISDTLQTGYTHAAFDNYEIKRTL